MTTPAGADVASIATPKRFPKWVHDPGEWALHTRTLTREQRAILLDLYGEAWVAGPSQDMLTSSELDFPRVIGPDWRDHLPWLALYFLPVPGAAAMLRAPFLTAKLAIANEARAKLSRAGKKSVQSRQQRTGTNNRRRKPPRDNGLNIVQQPMSNDDEQGSEVSSRDVLTNISREETGDSVAAVGRGGATAAPPSHAERDGPTLAVPESQRPLEELPRRGRDNTPVLAVDPELAAAEAWARRDPDAPDLIAAELERQWHASGANGDRALWTLGSRRAALRECYRTAQVERPAAGSPVALEVA